MDPVAVLLLSCPDQRGLVARISQFIYENGGNILDLDEHVDPEEEVFSIRVSWELEAFQIPTEELRSAIQSLAQSIDATWEIKFLHRKMRVAIFVSKYDHCLYEILWRHSIGEFNIEIPVIISNHDDLRPLAEQYGIPYYHFPITKENKEDQERREIEILQDNDIDTIVLARYMQILSPQFVNAYPNRIINIHHSFLPAFRGANPYRQAYTRGVKIIGATSHYVTEDLDEGPIIEQDIIKITHRDTLQDLKQKGRDLERMVLARALQHHFSHEVLVRGRKTIVFE
ncbi:MAG: formyltetrahydrofolate deformylase [Candidatus Marinimicrobia bacterium]|nr:formyltetrahydrofolate deformylase [Candidatus Neomarinimicrobiota bacterium]MCF7827659.1 formyltetrahydrofolate deformylase [Candidatus Neomarinimicrobiota bacterium]MCF7881286.1 formyltetrahydrofolate deformylase [Candidatus Neomarinimicrobiota bacterium]